MYIYRSLQHARLRRRQYRTVYAVLNRKQNLRSTYCGETNDRHEAARGLFATAEVLVTFQRDTRQQHFPVSRRRVCANLDHAKGTVDQYVWNHSQLARLSTHKIASWRLCSALLGATSFSRSAVSPCRFVRRIVALHCTVDTLWSKFAGPADGWELGLATSSGTESERISYWSVVTSGKNLIGFVDVWTTFETCRGKESLVVLLVTTSSYKYVKIVINIWAVNAGDCASEAFSWRCAVQIHFYY